MKNKSNLSKFTNIVLLITIIGIILVSGTFAKYTSTASGTSATVVAQWSFNVGTSDITQSKTFDFNLFDTANIKDSDGTSKETDVKEGLIAPGTSGAFEFALTNTSDVTAKYDIALTAVNEKNIPIEYSFDGKTWKRDITKVVATDIMARGATENVTVQWRWAFGENEITDVSLSGATVTVTANITATQVNNSDAVVDEEPEEETPEEPESNVLIANSEFVYGSNYDLSNANNPNTDKNAIRTDGSYGLGKTSYTLLKKQTITVKVTDTDVSKYNVTIGYFDAEGNYKGRSGILPMTNGELTINAGEIASAYFKVSVYIYSPFTKIPETAEIVVYEETPEEETPEEEESTRNVLIANSKFEYGAYYDITKFDSTNKDKLTTGAYVQGKTSDIMFTPQDITIKVTDTNLDNYCATLSWFDADGNYLGRDNTIRKMTDGEITFTASQMRGPYVRVSVYIYSGSFTTIPETAKIVVYAGDTVPNTDWQGKTITVAGDSISTGGWVGTLGNMTGATINNLSVSGTKLTTGILPKIQEMTGKSDLIIVFGGTNDYWHKGTQIGDLDSTNASTYCGALKTILTTLKTNYADSEYLFIFPYDQTFSGDASSSDYGYGSLDDFRTAFIEFCTQNNVNYIDLGATEFDCAQHTGDGVHPNSAGHAIIAETVYDYITNN